MILVTVKNSKTGSQYNYNTAFNCPPNKSRNNDL